MATLCSKIKLGGTKWCKKQLKWNKVENKMLIGEFKHNLDPKGRVTIPSKFREDLSVFVMTKGLDDCLFLYPKDQWEKIENKLKELPMTNKAVRSFVRTFFSGAVDCELDKQGRVLIAENLRDYADLIDKWYFNKKEISSVAGP